MQPQREADILEVFLGEYRSNLAQTLEGIAWYIKQIIQARAWESKTDQDGNAFKSFEHWVVDRGYWGLRSSISQLLDFCKSDQEAQTLIRAEIGEATKNGEIGNGRSSCDVITPTNRGTSETYLIKRLKRDKPELAEEVVHGRLSAYAAAVQAGIKKPTWTAPDDPELLAKKVEQKYPGWKMVREKG